MSLKPNVTKDLCRLATVKRLLDLTSPHWTFIAERPVYLALSGGKDSVVLLDALMQQWPTNAAHPLTLLHVNHHLQVHSSSWAEHCVALGKRYGLTCVVLDVAVSVNGNVEANARKARYTALFSKMSDDGVLLLGQHANDQVETLFLNLKRGAGSQGLSGMAVWQTQFNRFGAHPDMIMYRPLLGIAQEQIDSYAQHALQATDWVEDLMLRTQSPAVYDQWVSNDIKFNDPRVVAAIEEFGAFARNDDYVAGGANAVATTDFRDSPKGMFSSPAQCYMHRQASFIPAFFPEGTVVGEDADFFYFPAYASKNLGNPVLGAGTVWGITNDAPEAHALMTYLQSAEAHEIWMARKGFLTPHKGVDTSKFSDPTLRKMNDILLSATTFRFDASDLMPGAVGAGSFWTGMVDYSGGTSAQDAADAIQASWDAIPKKK